MRDYCVIKLVTGEQLIGEVVNKTREGSLVENPILLKHVPMIGKTGDITERVVTSRYCQYTTETAFFFKDSDVMFLKPLKESLVRHYTNLVKDFAEESELKLDEDYDDEAIEEVLKGKSIVH